MISSFREILFCWEYLAHGGGFKSRSVKLRSFSLCSDFILGNNFFHTVFTLRRSVKLASPLLPKDRHDPSKVWWAAEMVTIIFHYCPHIHTSLQYEFCSSSNQDLFPYPLNHGWPCVLLCQQNVAEVTLWKFCAWASRDHAYFYTTLGPLFTCHVNKFLLACWKMRDHMEEKQVIPVEPSWKDKLSVNRADNGRCIKPG